MQRYLYKHYKTQSFFEGNIGSFSLKPFIQAEAEVFSKLAASIFIKLTNAIIYLDWTGVDNDAHQFKIQLYNV